MSEEETKDPFGVKAGEPILHPGFHPESEVSRLAVLARITLSDRLRADMADRTFFVIASWFEEIKQVDTSDVVPMTSPAVKQARLREDRVDDGNVRDALLANASDTQHGFFVVPKVVE